ncbi:MAG: hypothetical protein IKR89_03940 [Bacteroidaceae bacterium]|nr:hypothetical protein [Bacteroidaceae bacterium]
MDKQYDIPYSEHISNITFLPDFELKYSEKDLDNLSKDLSEEDEKILKEILELETLNSGKTDFMKELLEAAKRGAMQYIDSMTDTGETFNRAKDPSSVSSLDNENIIKQHHSADPNEKRETRTMEEARYEAFDKNVSGTTTGMSEKGAILFARHKEAYSQRTKSVTGISNENNSINYKKNDSVNFESLSGLRGYRFGSVVPMYSVDEIQEMYAQKKEQSTLDNPSHWLMEENYKRFEDALMKEYGFTSRSEALNWMRENHLTIHEDPDGMYLVPTDVHDAVKHSGYRSKMTAFLKGEISKDDLNSYIIREKIEYVKHEAKVRSTRAIKGVGLSMMKDILKCSIVVICEETYDEFKSESKDKFIDRMLRIFKNSWEHVKAKCNHILSKIWDNIKGSLLSELLTALNDFFFGTFKNIFRMVRQMWGSIKSAFKIIFSNDKNVSFGERIYEASKVLSAGVVSFIGFSLNELIEKGLTSIGVPFASFVAECLSGLFAGIMSAIVIMLFDKFKKDFMTKSLAVKKRQLESKRLCINSAQIQISSLKLDMKTADTCNFVGQVFGDISKTRIHIQEQDSISADYNLQRESSLSAQAHRNSRLEDKIQKYINNDNF